MFGLFLLASTLLSGNALPTSSLQIPLAFTPAADSSFAVHSNGAAIRLSKSGVTIRLRGARGPIRMSFAGGRATALSGEAPLPGVTNYFIGNDPKRWRTNVPNFARVAQKSVYSGVDVVYYGSGSHLEYDLVVAPGADPSAIRLRFDGADLVSMAGDAAVIPAGDARIEMRMPRIYQADGAVTGRFIARGDHEIGFEVGAYDKTKVLILDPYFSYSTFLGGVSSDISRAIAIDATGAVYVTGQTFSPDFPTLPPYEDEFGGNGNVFITKLNPAGSALVYSTIIGGMNSQGGLGIAVDSGGNAYVTGATNSPNFPVVGAFQPMITSIANTNNGVLSPTQDAFVLKLNSAGNALLYSSFLGGSGADTGRAIAVDAAGNAYIAGNTQSLDFPVVNPIQRTKGDQNSFSNDGFIAKVNPSGSALVYSTFLGGVNDDQIAGLAIDGSGNVYVTGQTSSINFPTTPGAYQATRPGLSGGTHAFVTKVNAAGTALSYSSFLGGSGTDQAFAITADASGSAYVTGFSNSRDFPVIPLQQLIGTAFAVKFTPDGSNLVFARNFGGNNSDNPSSIALDSSSNLYVAGTTTSSNFPFVNAPEKLSDIFVNGSFFQIGYVIKFSADGSTIVYSTALGGGSDFPQAIAVDSSNAAYVTGYTNTVNFPTVNPLQQNYGGGTEAFITKLADGSQPAPQIFAGGIVNAASYRPASDPNGAIAAGTIAVIFGTNLAPGSRYISILPLPTTLFDDTVTINGTPAPFFYVSPTQINLLVPFTIATGSATVQVKRGDGQSATQGVTVSAVSPGIFFNLATGTTTPVGAILHAKDFSAVTPTNPAAPGEYLSIFATGLGALNQTVATGALPPSPPPTTLATPTVSVGGVNALVSYSGLAARLAGVYQVNVMMPAGVASGLQPVVLTIGGVPANTVMMQAR